MLKKLGVAVLMLGAARAIEEPLGPAEKPVPGKFPGETPADTDKAFPRGKQPKSLEAWPKQEDGEPAACWKTTVLNDEQVGWKAECLGLDQAAAFKTSASCKMACEADPKCPVWQYNDATGCWHNEGTDCGDTRSAFAASGSERLMHGDVNIIVANLTNVQIMHLEATGHKGSTPPLQMTEKEHEAEIKHCRNFCWSDINCMYWQYHPESGCYSDRNTTQIKALEMANPLTLEKQPGAPLAARADNAYTKGVMAGQYLQHFCPINPAGQSVVVPKEDKANLLWLWVLIGVLLLAAIALVAYFMLKPKAKKTRAIRVQPKVKEPEPVYVTYQMPIQTVAPIQTMRTVMPAATYAAPMQTYAAAPMQMQYAPAGIVAEMA